MSLILKGVDLPKEGELTFIAVCNDGRAYKMAMPPTGVLRLGPYADLYQAIQIPKGHGDIIDRSKVFAYGYWDERALNEVDPILEAEEE